MTPDKAAAFIEDCVVSRPRKTQCKKLKGTEVAGCAAEATIQTVGAATVDMYIAALVYFWERQVEQGVNSYPNPRVGGIKHIKATLKQQKVEKDRRSLKDRGAGEAFPH